jgi:hypothetical protein
MRVAPIPGSLFRPRLAPRSGADDAVPALLAASAPPGGAEVALAASGADEAVPPLFAASVPSGGAEVALVGDADAPDPASGAARERAPAAPAGGAR